MNHTTCRLSLLFSLVRSLLDPESYTPNPHPTPVNPYSFPGPFARSRICARVRRGDSRAGGAPAHYKEASNTAGDSLHWRPPGM